MIQWFCEVLTEIWEATVGYIPEEIHLARMYKKRIQTQRIKSHEMAYLKHCNHILVRGYQPYQWVN